MKVEASVISRGRGPRLITLAETLIILDITKTEFNYCFIINCFMENMQKLLYEIQVDFVCASKNTRTNAPSGPHQSKLFNILFPRGRASFWSAPRIATSGQVQRHSGFEWLHKHTRLRPEPIRFARLDSEHAHSDGKSLNNGLLVLDLARGRDSWC